MPRNLNPKNIKIGPGQTVPDRGADASLVDGAVVGGGGVGGDASLVLAALKVHIQDPKNAHEGSAIGLEPFQPFISDDVEGLFQEVAGGMPYEPPMLGRYAHYMDFHSVPDWGAAKLNDTPIFLRDGDFDDLINTNAYGDVFPYFLKAPQTVVGSEDMNLDVDAETPQQYSPGFLPEQPWVTPEYDGKVTSSKYNTRQYGTLFPNGGDIMADRIFNHAGILGADNPSVRKSGGAGRCYAGGFTRADDVVQKTMCLTPFEHGVDMWPLLVTISGSIYPADRGVLALLHFPHLETPATSPDVPWTDERRDAFLAQSVLTDRCIAALLLGQGVLGDACIEFGASSGPCDGGPGGIFSVGVDAEGNYDPFAYPGRAGGQYNLDELHTGQSSIPSVGVLPDPWDNLTGQGAGAGAKRAQYVAVGDDYYPAAGQVRLGSDPDVGTILTWGIPVLGGTLNTYLSSGAIPAYPAGSYVNLQHIGRSVIHTTNQFLYRLPVLDDYSETSGMKYTPKSFVNPGAIETYRYFYAESAASPEKDPFDYGSLSTELSVGGNYPPFQQDCLTWQLARYRHTFAMDGGLDAYPGVPTPLGSYALFHFKSEHDFEALMLDGSMPDELYGIHFLTDSSNVVNEQTDSVMEPEYMGPIPDFSYSANFYNGLRDEVFVGGSEDDHKVQRTDVTSSLFTWSAPLSSVADPGIVYISGVAYFTPRKIIGGTSSFQFNRIEVGIDNTWTGCYRTDAEVPSSAPAVFDSPNPGFLNLKPFMADTSGLPASYPVGPQYRQDYRIEFPFTGFFDPLLSPYSNISGPATGDPLILLNTDPVEIPGDETTPSFSTNAKPVFYVRRPLTHGGDWEDVIQPSWSTSGSGVVTGHGVDLTALNTVLFHSTNFSCTDIADKTTGIGRYGNFVSTTPITSFAINLYPAFDSLLTKEKDVEERFLDEVYRYLSLYDLPGATEAFLKAATVGPGMSTWNGGPVPIPVQAGAHHGAADFPAPWDTFQMMGPDPMIEFVNLLSWTQLPWYTRSLKDIPPSPAAELQVCGLPPRNPPVLDWAEVPFPSAGVLRYPAVDYTSGSNRPNVTDDASITLVDYSGTWGASLKNYIRFFDAAFSRWGGTTTPPVEAAGQPFVTLRIEGVTLSDFTYMAPGPGTTASGTFPAIAIQVKIPGLTTWMDIGRIDGSGPSKQDPNIDGAGCMVLGQHTFDSINPETGMVYSQIHVNVGPMANLATGIRAVTSPDIYEVPVGVKVIMNDMAEGEYDLISDSDGSLGGEGLNASKVRGITTIKIVHPTQVETAPTT